MAQAAAGNKTGETGRGNSYSQPHGKKYQFDTLDDVTVYSSRLVIPVTAPVIVNGAVAVSADRVVHVGTRRWVLSELKQELSQRAHLREYHWDGIIMPGLVNAHTHLQYSGMGDVGKGHYGSFHEWERAFDAVYENPSQPHDWKHWARVGARQLIRAGTTAAADIVTDMEAADALVSQGLHGIAYLEVIGWHNDDWQRQGRLELNRRLHKLRSERVPDLGISPHAPYTLESEPFVELPDIARRMNMRLHIHLAETPLESGSVAAEEATYPSADSPTTGWRGQHWSSYRELKKRGLGVSAIEFVDQLGSLGPDVHIAHGVWANADDRRILRQRRVSVALCPRSNRVTNTGRDASIREYLEEGNDLSIGTDSLSSSPSLDLLEESAVVYELARQQGYNKPDLARRLIHIMTLDGAAAMGMHVGQDRIGQINAGALADLAFFDLPISVDCPAHINDALESLVRYGAGSNRATLLSGRIVYNDGVFQTP